MEQIELSRFWRRSMLPTPRRAPELRNGELAPQVLK